MYQTIVFLPLLGAILAALISLTGARARHPGGTPGAAAHPHAAPSSHDPAHDRLADPHGQPPAHPPSALGSRLAELITTGLLFFSMILSWIVLVQVGFGKDAHVALASWVVAGDLKFAWAL